MNANTIRADLRRLATLGGVFVSTVASPAQSQDSAGALLLAERGVSAASDRSGLGTALGDVLHPEAVLVWPGAPVAAGADARRLLGAQPLLDSLRVNWQPLGVELARDSSLGVTWGVAMVTARAAPAPPQVGRYIAVWRTDGSRWGIAALLLAGPFPSATTAASAGVSPRRARAAATGPAGPFVDADLAFARLAGDSGAGVAFERWAAPEVVMVDGAGLLVRGPAAVGALVAGPASWRWHPVAAGAAETGDLGWTVGEAVIAPPGGAPLHSKYLTIWRRLPDGAIRFLTDGGNARPAP